MTKNTQHIDPRYLSIIKELVAWDNQEFDGNGRPSRSEDPENTYTCPCPDTALERAQRALRDMKHWALEGRRIDAQHGLDDLERDLDRDGF